MAYTTSQIAAMLGAKTSSAANLPVSHLLIDSRSLIDPAETMFFAITTATNDGHRYIAELYENGVRAFVVNRVPEEMHLKSDAVDPLDALQGHDTILDTAIEFLTSPQ